MELTRLSDLQYQIMTAVIKLQDANVRQVQEELAHLNLAYTTVATLLTRLEKKGLLESSAQGRTRVYRSKHSAASLKRSMVDSLLATAFTGNPVELIAHLVSDTEFDPDELDELRKLISKGDTRE